MTSTPGGRRSRRCWTGPRRSRRGRSSGGVEALQRKGRHREALELMNRVAIADAPPADAKRFAKLRATSERTLERAVVDPDRFESEGDGMIVRRKRQPYAKLRWAAAAAGLLAFVYFAYAIYLGTSRRAYLINGTDVAYTATIDGHAHALQPREVKPIRVGEGDIAIGLAAPGYTGPAPGAFHFATSVFTRPFNGSVLAINPDRLAPIVRGEVVYGGGHATEPDVLYIGEVAQVLPSTDYAFENPPASVNVKSNEAPPHYTVATVEHGRTSGSMVGQLLEEHDPRATAVARQMLAFPIDDADELQPAVAALGRADCVALLKPHLAGRADRARGAPPVSEPARGPRRVRGRRRRVPRAAGRRAGERDADVPAGPDAGHRARRGDGAVQAGGVGRDAGADGVRRRVLRAGRPAPIMRRRFGRSARPRS